MDLLLVSKFNFDVTLLQLVLRGNTRPCKNSYFALDFSFDLRLLNSIQSLVWFGLHWIANCISRERCFPHLVRCKWREKRKVRNEKCCLVPLSSASSSEAEAGIGGGGAMLLTEAQEAKKVNCGDDMSALPTAASNTRFAHFCTIYILIWPNDLTSLKYFVATKQCF